MKNLVLLIMVMCFGTFQAQAETTFDVRLTEVSNDGINYVVKVEMQMFGEDPATFKLGSTAIQFAYPQTAFSNPVVLSHAFGDSFFYLAPTATTPVPGECSFNIELSIPNMGITIPTGDEWIVLGEISFTIDDLENYAPMHVLYTGGTTKTVAFLDDETTQIFMAQNQIASIEDVDVSTQTIVAYPNPNNGDFIHVALANVNVNQKVVVNIVDQLGKIVYSEEINTKEKGFIQKVDFNQKLVSGMYTINLIIEENTISKKFAVK